MSLSRWANMGYLNRELEIYQCLGQKIGHVYIYSYGKDEKEYVKGYDNISVMSKPRFFPTWSFLPNILIRVSNQIYNIYTIISQRKLLKSIDIIKTNQFIGSGWGLVFKVIFNAKLVVRMGYYHTIDFRRFSNKREYFIKMLLEKYIFPRADGLIFTDPLSEKFVQNNYSLRDTICITIPNLINTKIFRPIISGSKYDIVCVGRINQNKNQILLLESIKNLGLKVLFIGDGPHKDLSVSVANKYKIELLILNNIPNNELPIYYNQSKLFVLLSQYDSNPKSLLEAMSCGVICVGSNVPNINQIITHNHNGLLTNLESSCIRKTIIDALSDNNINRSNISRLSRKYVINNNDMEQAIDIESKFLTNNLY